MHFDVFNGDADGICALHQLRLVFPRVGTLVTGVKRDISLLKKVDSADAKSVTVLDISLDANRDDLVRLLESGAEVEYFDHHFAGDIPNASNLRAYIDLDPRLCTSLIVDRFLHGAHRAWAVVAAFGDNLHTSANDAALPLNLETDQLEQLRQLGEAINYNAYGESEADLHYPPANLYRALSQYSNPFEFIACEDIFQALHDGYAKDMNRVLTLAPEFDSNRCGLYILPNQAGSRRISGMFANRLAQSSPDKALAILTPRQDGDYTVSLRAPASNPIADTVCREFASGGGRKTAAGINHLPQADVEQFAVRFQEAFS